jgi:hypothetical protein
MWIPKAYGDLELALGVQIESESLDFKSALPTGQKARDLAKDAAAMSLAGGVIVVGLEEQEGVASAISPIELAGAVERVQQIVDAHVAPALPVDIWPIRRDAEDDEGVLVVSVPASWSAPHQYEHRFPARSGSTTRWLTEREVELLYNRRLELQQQGQQQLGLVGHQLPPDVEVRGVDDGIGVLRMHLRPHAGGRHPLEPHLGQALRRAVTDATDNVGELIRPQLTPKSFDFLRRWKPAGADGWRAGEFVSSAERLAAGVAVGGFYRYGAGFSFTVAISQTVGLEPDADSGSRCTFEHLWAAETMALLSIGGSFFAPLPETSLLRVDLELGGLLGSTSWQASQGLAFSSDAPKVSENQYLTGGAYAARGLSEDPRDPTRQLLDPFMVAILSEGSDIVDLISA